MLTSYIKIIARNYTRNKLYSAINTFGLALGYAAFILIAIYLLYETSFESFHNKADRIYRPTYHYNSGNGFTADWARIPVDYINELPNEFPEVEKLIRFQNQERKYVRIGLDKFRPEHIYVVDKEVFDVFDFRLVSGNPEVALKEPNSIVISEELARKFFGHVDVVGEDIFILGDWNPEETRHEITGVMQDLPSHTHLPVEMLISFQNEEERKGWAYVYLLLHEGAQIETILAKMPEFVRKFRDGKGTNEVEFQFQSLYNIHLHSDLAREITPNGRAIYVKVFAAIGLFILAMAIMNFINLNSAMFIGRYKEIGLRKILGAGKAQLSAYIIVESISFNLLALLLGACIAILTFPYFRNLTEFTVIIHPIWITSAMIIIACLCGLLAAIYPIIRLHTLNPIEVLKNSFGFSIAKKGGRINVKRILITLQFCISMLMIGSAFIAMDQFNYLSKKNLGIEKEQILAIHSVPDRIKDDFEIFKERLNSIPGVERVAGCMEVPSREIRDAGPVLVKGVNDDPEKAPIMDIQIIDHDYIDLLQAELIAGKNIPQSLAFEPIPPITDNYTIQDHLLSKRRAYLINETAMKQLGWQHPEEAIGQQISWSIGSFKLAYGPISGIVKDYHQESFRNTIDPTILVFEPIWLRTFLVKIDAEQIQETVAGIASTWDELFPFYPIEYHFLDDMYDKLYKNDRVQIQLLYMLSTLAMIIAFVGLFGLVAFSLKARIKEIAVRQILGADMSNLIRMIGKEYLLLLVIATLLATPVSYYFVENWLQEFAYKTSISPLWFIITFLLIGFLILITITLQTLKAALVNPAKTLREE